MRRLLLYLLIRDKYNRKCERMDCISHLLLICEGKNSWKQFYLFRNEYFMFTHKMHGYARLIIIKILFLQLSLSHNQYTFPLRSPNIVEFLEILFPN